MQENGQYEKETAIAEGPGKSAAQTRAQSDRRLRRLSQIADCPADCRDLRTKKAPDDAGALQPREKTDQYLATSGPPNR
jgi:hypothetical protein